ncbi:MAG: hypothetical protein KF769_16090 [Parvibaculum sp.]|nr:hypothetical protein [Parvibaculum sp.]
MHKRRLSDLTSRSAVLAAIAEYDRLGQDEFLAKYDYGKARRYFLEHNSRQYDSKAIAGAAVGFQFPADGPLEYKTFTGGRRTVKAKLEELGFSIAVLPPAARQQPDAE